MTVNKWSDLADEDKDVIIENLLESIESLTSIVDALETKVSMAYKVAKFQGDSIKSILGANKHMSAMLKLHQDALVRLAKRVLDSGDQTT